MTHHNYDDWQKEKARAEAAESELAAVRYAAHMPEDYGFGLASWINQTLYASYVGARLSPHILQMVNDGTLEFSHAPVLKRAEAARDRALAEAAGLRGAIDTELLGTRLYDSDWDISQTYDVYQMLQKIRVALDDAPLTALAADVLAKARDYHRAYTLHLETLGTEDYKRQLIARDEMLHSIDALRRAEEGETVP